MDHTSFCLSIHYRIIPCSSCLCFWYLSNMVYVIVIVSYNNKLFFTAVVILSSNYNNLGTMEYNRTKEASNML